jgi:hypothetical protein
VNDKCISSDEIKELRKEIKEVKDLLTDFRLVASKELASLEIKLGNSVSKLEVKSGVWGALGGLVPVIITIFTILLSMKL